MAAETALSFLRKERQPARLPTVFLISGSQAFLREYVLDVLRELLGRLGCKYCAFQVLGREDAQALLNEAGGRDLFSPRRFLVVRIPRFVRERAGDAGEASSGRASGSRLEAALAEAVAAVRPPDYLALLYERESAPATVRRAVERDGLAINCLRPFDNQLASYAEIFASRRGLKLAPAAAELLVARHGGDLFGMANALSRLAILHERGARLEPADLGGPAAAPVPEMFDLAASLGRASASSALALFDRALGAGREVVELLSTEIVPAVRRMMVAAAMLEEKRSAADVASALGTSPTSPLLFRALEGARRFGPERLGAAYRRAAELDAGLKGGTVRAREQAVAALLLDLLGAKPD